MSIKKLPQREKPKSRSQWTALAVEACSTIGKHSTDPDIRALALAVNMILIGPEPRRNWKAIGDCIDQMEGIEREDHFDRHMREREEKNTALLQRLRAYGAADPLQEESQ